MTFFNSRALFYSFLLFVCSREVFASNYILLTGQNATNSTLSTYSAEASLSSKKSGDGPKEWYYDVDYTGEAVTSPVAYPSTPIPKLKSISSLPINTTLYTIDNSFSLDLNNPRGWLFGLGYESSRQQGTATPTTYSNTISGELGQTFEYGQKPKSGQDSEGDEDKEPAASFGWKIGYGTALISSDAYGIVENNVAKTIFSEPPNSIGQNSWDIDLTWDPQEWITMKTMYEQYAYSDDPNNFAPLKTPKLGLPTSLEAYEITGTVTFHLGDSWDLEAKEAYSLAATSDQTVTDEETYTLTYIADSYEVGVGFDHLNPNTSSPTDSAIVSLRLNF